jgi:hypothetical protein
MKICPVAMMLVWLCSAAAVGAQPIAGGPPGSMRLLEGYQHERLRGMDTTVGRIWKPGGPEVHYDIGQLAGNHARQTDMRRWSKRQSIGGRSFTLTMQTDDTLILTFDQGTANFFVRGIRGDEEFAEILLMLLSY